MERFLEGHRREERSKKEEKERMRNSSVGDKRDREGKFVSGGGKEEEVVEENVDKSGKIVDGNVASAATSTDVKTAAVDADADVATAEKSDKHPREEENEEGAATKKQKLDEEGS